MIICSVHKPLTTKFKYLLADDICTSVGITSFKKHLVAKESRYEVPYKDRLRFH